jgi:hypothetical protein
MNPITNATDINHYAKHRVARIGGPQNGERAHEHEKSHWRGVSEGPPGGAGN